MTSKFRGERRVFRAGLGMYAKYVSSIICRLSEAYSWTRLRMLAPVNLLKHEMK